MQNLTSLVQDIIRRQEELLDTLRRRLVEPAARRTDAEASLRLARSVATLRNELNAAAPKDAAHVAAQLHVVSSLAAHRAAKRRPDPLLPYFGYLRLACADGRVREILVGETAFLDAADAVPLVEWSVGPFAELFFTTRAGDEFDIDLPNGRGLAGVVAERLVVSFVKGRLARIDRDGGALLRDARGVWSVAADQVAARLGGGEGASVVDGRFGTGATNAQGPVVKALLDQHQYALIQESPDAPLLIVGSAGSGKTTVALHRLVSLSRRDPVRFAPERLLVVVPEKGLAALTRRLLDDLGLGGIAVQRFDAWIVSEGRRILRGLPKRLCTETPAVVRRFKGHAAFKAVLAQYMKRLEAGVLDRAAVRPHLFSALSCAAFDAASDKPLLERLRIFQREALRTARGQESVIKAFFRDERARIFDWETDRAELFAEPTLLAVAVAASGGELSDAAARTLTRHTRAQLAESAAARYDGWSDDVMVAADGVGLDAGTPDEIAGSIDVEDYPVLLELLRLKTGAVSTRTGALATFEHLVVDEAQEYAPMELTILGRALSETGNVTVAGDDAQQTDQAGPFRSWDATLAALGRPVVAARKLTISYRSARPIMEFGRMVLGPLAPREAPVCKKDGPSVKISATASLAESLTFVADALRDLRASEPAATIAVVCGDLSQARLAFERLDSVPGARLVDDGDFSFRPGVDFTDGVQVKGLEFDYVVIPDASAKVYGDDVLARRRLHVAATRAIHQLWVLSGGQPSPLLAPSCLGEQIEERAGRAR